MKKVRQVSITLTEEQCSCLQALAKEADRTRSGYIRRLIDTCLRRIDQDPGQKIK